MSHTTPIHWTRKTDKLRELFEKQLAYAPHTSTLYVKPADYVLLKSSVPKTWIYDGVLIYGGRPIKPLGS